MGCAVMITSGKGGTGKTSLTAGVASCLAALGQRVLCIDMDIGLRNLDLVLGLSDRAVMDFSDVMDYRCSLLEAAAEQPEIKGLFLLTAPLSPDALDRERFRAVVDEAKDCFDFVLMDSPAGLGDGFQLARAAADRAIVVSAVDPAALRDAQRTVTELDHLRQVHLIMNRIQTRLLRRLRTTIDDAMNTAGLPLVGVVPEDPQVILCANLGKPLTTRGKRGAALACWNIAQRLDGNKVPIMKIR